MKWKKFLKTQAEICPEIQKELNQMKVQTRIQKKFYLQMSISDKQKLSIDLI